MAAPDIPLDAWWGGRVVPQHFRMFSGDDRTITFTVRDRAGAAVSITGTYAFTIASGRRPSDSAEVEKTGAISSSSVAVTLAGSDTSSLDGEYHWEMQVTETSSSADSIVAFGTVTIREDMD